MFLSETPPENAGTLHYLPGWHLQFWAKSLCPCLRILSWECSTVCRVSSAVRPHSGLLEEFAAGTAALPSDAGWVFLNQPAWGPSWQWPPGSCHIMRSISHQSHLVNDNIISVWHPQRTSWMCVTSTPTEAAIKISTALIKVSLEPTNYNPQLWKRCIKSFPGFFYSVSTPRRLTFVFSLKCKAKNLYLPQIMLWLTDTSAWVGALHLCKTSALNKILATAVKSWGSPSWKGPNALRIQTFALSQEHHILPSSSDAERHPRECQRGRAVPGTSAPHWAPQREKGNGKMQVRQIIHRKKSGPNQRTSWKKE